VAQFIRPDFDQSIGAWTGDPIDTTGDRHTNIDEVVRADGDWVRSENDPSDSTVIFRLSDADDPVSSVDHVIRYAYRKNTSGGGSQADVDIIITLKDGLTTIASQTHLVIATGLCIAGTFTLSAGEADTIGNYNNLIVELNADRHSGARTSWAEISWFELEVPNAPAGGATPYYYASLIGG